MPPLTPPPASQMVKPNWLWSRPSRALGERRAAELAGPDHQRRFQQAARLQVLEQPGDRLIDGRALSSWPFLQVAVLVPAVVRRRWGRSAR